ncbi:MAG: helix-turn-helix domain-containing protein [Paenisporosarcina sp.]
MYIEEADYLAHYGVLRRSGRYPWNSGLDENTHNKHLLNHISELKKEGLSEKEIAQGLGMTTTQLRKEKSNAVSQQRQANIVMAQRLKDKGYSPTAIGQRMNVPESTVRSWLKPGADDKANVINTTSDALRSRMKELPEGGMLDIGKGSEYYLGISSTKLKNVVAKLEEEGYETHTIKVRQLTTGKDTNTKVLCQPGTTWGQAQKNRHQVELLGTYSENGGRGYNKILPSLAIDPKRVGVLHKGEGGEKADGVIYVRPGIDDVSLGGSPYAQVRIQVGDGHYLKGMAIYRDDLPKGVDLLFNTNKENTGNKLDAMKPLSDKQDLPFGSIVRQIVDKPGHPDAKVTSVVNIVAGNVAAERGNEAGTWSGWSNALSSQMLSKQSPALAKSQLDMTYERREREFNQIMELTNPTVRQTLLKSFSDSTDASAVHLEAAALPRQANHVILPVASMKPTEVYAPNYNHGEQVALIRHPHGGTFEIPNLVVNNRQHEARKLLGPTARDAIGINHEVAQRLSGADFDGDTVLVIPNNQGRLTITPALEQLKGFDPRASYPGYEGMPKIKNMQTEMGKVSNLITDMTIKMASHDEIARAVKHSMVIIDSEKGDYGLDYKLSFNDHGIKQLKDKYQKQPDGSSGASTLISRARARLDIPDRKPRPYPEGGPINRETGELEYVPTNKVSYKTGKPRTIKTTKLGEAKDAATLSSGTPMETLYANHSNKLKALANKARLAMINTPPQKYSASAKETYKSEVASLDSKLALAKRNAPLERKAQLIADAEMRIIRDENPNMVNATRIKLEHQTLNEARIRTGASKYRIVLTPHEWEAIQAGAISHSKLTDILTNTDTESIRKLATPKDPLMLTHTEVNRAKTMLSSGYTRADVASALGVSVSTLDTMTNE